MRFLTVVRHAESTPARVGEADYDRALSARGRDQCAQLRARAVDAGALGRFGPVTALVSGAARTRETYELAFAGTPFAGHVQYSDQIYNGARAVEAEDLLAELAAIDPGTTSLLVIAHNPTVLDLVAEMADPVPGKVRRGHFPTGAAYVLELPDDRTVGLMRYPRVAKYVAD